MAKEKFEEALGRLEDIVKKMEAGDMTLEESLKAFEEGIKLVRLCSRKLDEAERRVEILLKQEEELVIKPFKVEENESECSLEQYLAVVRLSQASVTCKTEQSFIPSSKALRFRGSCLLSFFFTMYSNRPKLLGGYF